MVEINGQINPGTNYAYSIVEPLNINQIYLIAMLLFSTPPGLGRSVMGALFFTPNRPLRKATVFRLSATAFTNTIDFYKRSDGQA